MVDEYQIEIQALRRRLSRLRADQASGAVIEDNAAELRNLIALCRAAELTFDSGAGDARTRAALAQVGFGDWTFDNVYTFVYEAAMEADTAGKDLAAVISHTDFSAVLLDALDDDSPVRKGKSRAP